MAALEEGPFEAEVERITLRGEGGEPVDAIHARPDGLPIRGIVMHPDVMGIRPLFDDLCRRLATHGFAVCAPEPFAHLDNRDELDPPARLERVKDLEDSVQIGNLERAADYLVVHDDVSDVAVMGFCLGGMYALKAAATDRFDRAVVFYGMIRVPEPWRSPNLAEPLDVAGAMAPTLAILGANDPYTPPADIDALRDAWGGRDGFEVIVYEGAEHGFVHDADRPAHRAEDAADAWSRVLAFLGAKTAEADAAPDASPV
jgi:carboxymethylenebutenolidase